MCVCVRACIIVCFSLSFFRFKPFTSLISLLALSCFGTSKKRPSFIWQTWVQGKSITQVHGAVIVIVYNAQANNLLSEWINANSGNLFSLIPHMRNAWQMSAVQAHQVIKFRFIRLISILIKTLTPPSPPPPYAIKGPRHLFCTHEEREMDRQREWGKRARNREGRDREKHFLSHSSSSSGGAIHHHSISWHLLITIVRD